MILWQGIHLIVDVEVPVELLPIHIELIHTIGLKDEDVFYSPWERHILDGGTLGLGSKGTLQLFFGLLTCPAIGSVLGNHRVSLCIKKEKRQIH